MMSEIRITQEIEHQIRKHAERDYPFECCGFLYGKDDKIRTITIVKEVENSKAGDQRRRFEISPLDYIKAEKYALMENLHLVGIYHSHPDHPAVASEHDLAKAMPFFSYVIVSVRAGVSTDIKSWRLKDNERKFEEESVQLNILNTVFK